LLSTRRPPTSTLRPYTTLFRSLDELRHLGEGAARARVFEQRRIVDDSFEEGLPSDAVALHDPHQIGEVVRGDGVDLGRRGHLARSEEHTSELQSRENLVCRLLL